VSALLEIAYFALLTTAYSRSDLSLVYPVARGSAPVLVLAGAALVGVTVGWLQALGVVLVGCGILLVRGLSGETDARGVILALAIGAAIAGYTLIDKEGVEHASVIAYFELVLAPVALVALGWHVVTGRVQSAPRSAGRRSAPRCSHSPRTRWFSRLSRWLRRPRLPRSARRACCLRSCRRGSPAGAGRSVRIAGTVLVVVGVAFVALG
jgi:hypothetical protein